MRKINGKVILIIVIWLLVISLLVYSRFINLGWGLPYPMHPDERNMANALQGLKCEFSISQLADCFNPHFFAYGQFPLYLGYLLTWIFKGFKNFGSLIISFEEAVMSLRVISAMASIINVFVLVKIINLVLKKNRTLLIILILTFSPFFIQFSHFGTTESFLMLFCLFFDAIIKASYNLRGCMVGTIFWAGNSYESIFNNIYCCSTNYYII